MQKQKTKKLSSIRGSRLWGVERAEEGGIRQQYDYFWLLWRRSGVETRENGSCWPSMVVDVVLERVEVLPGLIAKVFRLLATGVGPPRFAAMQGCVWAD